MTPDPRYVLDGGQLAIWEQTVAAAGMRGLDPPAANAWNQGIAPALPDGSYVVAPQGFFQQGAVGDDAVWVRNAFVQAAQNTGKFQGAVVRLMPTTYTFNTTAVGNEFCQLIGAGFGATIVKLGTAGIPAFQWTPQNSASYQQLGYGGILPPGLTISGPGSTADPADGSIGVQMGDIVRLQSYVTYSNLQTGLLLSNQFFQSEQGMHNVRTQGVTNPVICQTAASGGAGRNGSFDRTRFTVYHDDIVSGAYGNGVQFLAGATLRGGSLRQYGNFSGTGQAGVFALVVSGTSPVGGSNSSIQYAELTHSLEWDGSGTAPGDISIGSGCSIIATGILDYISMGSVVSSGTFNFQGPINGDSTLSGAGGGSYTGVAAALTGGSGSMFFAPLYRLNFMWFQSNISMGAAATIPHGTTVVSGIGSPFAPSGGREIALYARDATSANTTVIPCQITTGGAVVTENSATFTYGATGGTLGGSGVYGA